MACGPPPPRPAPLTKQGCSRGGNVGLDTHSPKPHCGVVSFQVMDWAPTVPSPRVPRACVDRKDSALTVPQSHSDARHAGTLHRDQVTCSGEEALPQGCTRWLPIAIRVQECGGQKGWHSCDKQRVSQALPEAAGRRGPRGLSEDLDGGSSRSPRVLPQLCIPGRPPAHGPCVCSGLSLVTLFLFL